MPVRDAADMELVQAVLLGDLPDEHAAVPHPQDVPIACRERLGWRLSRFLPVAIQDGANLRGCIPGRPGDPGKGSTPIAQPEDLQVAVVLPRQMIEPVSLGNKPHTLPSEADATGDLRPRQTPFAQHSDLVIALDLLDADRRPVKTGPVDDVIRRTWTETVAVITATQSTRLLCAPQSTTRMGAAGLRRVALMSAAGHMAA